MTTQRADFIGAGSSGRTSEGPWILFWRMTASPNTASRFFPGTRRSRIVARRLKRLVAERCLDVTEIRAGFNRIDRAGAPGAEEQAAG